MITKLEIKCDGELISSLVLVVEELRSRKFALIEEVKTAEGYRHKGYATNLIQLAIQKAKELHCDTVELNYNPKDELATRLYDKCGFKPDGNIRAKFTINETGVGRW